MLYFFALKLTENAEKLITINQIGIQSGFRCSLFQAIQLASSFQDQFHHYISTTYLRV